MGELRHDEAAGMTRSLQPFLLSTDASDPPVRAAVEQVAGWCAYLTSNEFTPSIGTIYI